MDVERQILVDASRYAAAAATLAGQLYAEAEWMEGRAKELDALARMAHKGPNEKAGIPAALRAEAARFRARAILARMEVQKALA